MEEKNKRGEEGTWKKKKRGFFLKSQQKVG
jgi:hypothetical protein